uniref:5'-nucleotidase n=1 Tax=Rhabditophanes sp. KR3021 TaxID=114890 RepID=A0AC35U2F1_9BILA
MAFPFTDTLKAILWRALRSTMEYLLKNPKIHIRDKVSVAQKLTKMSHDGKNGLMVISDFDYTLSRFNDEEGNKCWSTHGIFDTGARKNYPELCEELSELKDKYIKIEFCPTLTDAEKTPYMVRWWSESEKIVAKGFTYELIESFVKDCKIEFRTGGEDFIETQKLTKMSHDGKNGLMVISDFDYTLSRFSDEEGNKCWSTHGIFDIGARKNYPEFCAELSELKDKYIKIEFCPTLTDAEKTPYMVRWWSECEKIVAKGFTYELIESFVKDCKIEFRTGGEDFIESLNTHNVPLIIFSAGIGNIIEIFLKQTLKEVPNNVHIISNMMTFDEKNVVTAFEEPLIHTFYIHMDVGVVDESTVLKIGFLNFNEETLLPKYSESYDIVLIDDQTFSVPQYILNIIENQTLISLPHMTPLSGMISDDCHLSVDSPTIDKPSAVKTQANA